MERKSVINVRKKLQHKLNPAHIYCRLRWVFSRQPARELCWLYEQTIWKLIRGVIYDE